MKKTTAQTVREQELTTRDCQAMYNFSHYGVKHATIAEHFGCSVAFVTEQVETRPWLRPSPCERDLGDTPTGLSWWESNHRDPLELVKLYYSEYLDMYPDIETVQAERQQDTAVTLDAETYLEKHFGYQFVTPDNIHTVNRVLESLMLYLDESEKSDIKIVEEKLSERIKEAA